MAARIDDRLIHGQVIVGWGRPLRIDRFVVVDDQIAAVDFEQDLYRLAVPPGIAVEFLTTTDAVSRIPSLTISRDRVMVLTATVSGMAALVHGAPGKIPLINLGGIHQGPGRIEYLRYVFLTPEERSQLAQLVSLGARVEAQDVPTTTPVQFNGDAS